MIEPYMDLLWFKNIYGRSFRNKANAAAYYLKEGEQRGEWPNPVFDPNHYRTCAKLNISQSAIMHYLVHKGSGGCRPSKYFDAEWYQWQNSDVEDFGCSIIHYLRRGGGRFLDPSPEVDMVGLSRTHGHFGDGCVLTYMLSNGYFDIDSNLAITPSEAVLVGRQRLFLKDTRPVLLKSINEDTHRSNLLFVQCAKGSEFWSWFDVTAHRDWDLFLNCYAGDFEDTKSADYVCVQKGTKFTGILNCWLGFSEIFERYESVLFIDDDLIFEFADISRFFSLMRYYKLDLAQPSLSPNSQCVWPDFFNAQRTGVRKSNAVEIMMPAMSRRARKHILPYFVYSVSGFGLDCLMARLATLTHLSCGIVDDIVVRHEKKIDQSSGAYYEFLRSRGINSKYELWRLITKFGLECSLHALK